MTISIMSGNLSPLLNRYFVCHIRLVLVLKRTLPSIDYILSHPPTPICDYMIFCTFCKYCVTFLKKRQKKVHSRPFFFSGKFHVWQGLDQSFLVLWSQEAKCQESQAIVDAGHTDTFPRENVKKYIKKKIRNQKDKIKNQSSLISGDFFRCK